MRKPDTDDSSSAGSSVGYARSRQMKLKFLRKRSAPQRGTPKARRRTTRKAPTSQEFLSAVSTVVGSPAGSTAPVKSGGPRDTPRSPGTSLAVQGPSRNLQDVALSLSDEPSEGPPGFRTGLPLPVSDPPPRRRKKREKMAGAERRHHTEVSPTRRRTAPQGSGKQIPDASTQGARDARQEWPRLPTAQRSASEGNLLQGKAKRRKPVSAHAATDQKPTERQKKSKDYARTATKPREEILKLSDSYQDTSPPSFLVPRGEFDDPFKPGPKDLNPESKSGTKDTSKSATRSSDRRAGENIVLPLLDAGRIRLSPLSTERSQRVSMIPAPQSGDKPSDVEIVPGMGTFSETELALPSELFGQWAKMFDKKGPGRQGGVDAERRSFGTANLPQAERRDEMGKASRQVADLPPEDTGLPQKLGSFGVSSAKRMSTLRALPQPEGEKRRHSKRPSVTVERQLKRTIGVDDLRTSAGPTLPLDQGKQELFQPRRPSKKPRDRTLVERGQDKPSRAQQVADSQATHSRRHSSRTGPLQAIVAGEPRKAAGQDTIAGTAGGKPGQQGQSRGGKRFPRSSHPTSRSLVSKLYRAHSESKSRSSERKTLGSSSGPQDADGYKGYLHGAKLLPPRKEEPPPFTAGPTLPPVKEQQEAGKSTEGGGPPAVVEEPIVKQLIPPQKPDEKPPAGPFLGSPLSSEVEEEGAGRLPKGGPPGGEASPAPHPYQPSPVVERVDQPIVPRPEEIEEEKPPGSVVKVKSETGIQEGKVDKEVKEKEGLPVTPEDTTTYEQIVTDLREHELEKKLMQPISDLATELKRDGGEEIVEKKPEDESSIDAIAIETKRTDMQKRATAQKGMTLADAMKAPKSPEEVSEKEVGQVSKRESESESKKESKEESKKESEELSKEEESKKESKKESEELSKEEESKKESKKESEELSKEEESKKESKKESEELSKEEESKKESKEESKKESEELSKKSKESKKESKEESKEESEEKSEKGSEEEEVAAKGGHEVEAKSGHEVTELEARELQEKHEDAAVRGEMESSKFVTSQVLEYSKEGEGEKSEEGAMAVAVVAVAAPGEVAKSAEGAEGEEEKATAKAGPPPPPPPPLKPETVKITFMKPVGNEAFYIATTRKRTIPLFVLVGNVAVLIIFLVFSYFGLFWWFYIGPITPLRRPPKEKLELVCRNIRCGVAGSTLYYALNNTIPPCESMFQFVCSQWIHQPSGEYQKVVLGAEKRFLENMYDKMRQIVERFAVASLGDTALGKMANLYRGCLNQEYRDNEGSRQLKTLMNQYQLQKWPFESDFSGSVEDLVAKFIRDTGSGIFVSVRLVLDREDPESREKLVALECSSFVIPIDTLLTYRNEQKEMVKGYKNYISHVVEEFTGRAIDTAVSNIFAFEVNLAFRCNVQCRRKRLKKVQVKDLKQPEGEDGIDWVQFLKTIFHPINYSITEETYVLVRSTSYLKKLIALLRADATKVRAINYLGWRFMHQFSRHASTQLRNEYKSFHETVLAREELSDWKRCLFDVSDAMPFAIGRAYADYIHWRATDFQVHRMVTTLVDMMDFFVWRLKWIKPDTRAKFKSIVSRSAVNIGYPQWVMNNTALDAHHSSIPASAGYLQCYASALKNKFQNHLKTIVGEFQLMNKMSYFLFPTRIVELHHRTGPPRDNLFYDIRDNTFVVPTGVFASPYYSSEATAALNFGGLGMLVARDLVNEFFHAVDAHWMSDTERQQYKTKSECIMKAIAKSTNRPVSENLLRCAGLVADFLALRIAYSAYHSFLNFKDEGTLPGLEGMNPDQVFFIAAIRTLCTRIRETHYVQVVRLKMSVTELDHMDGVFKIMDEWTDAFYCNPAPATESAFSECFTPDEKADTKARRRSLWHPPTGNTTIVPLTTKSSMFRKRAKTRQRKRTNGST